MQAEQAKLLAYYQAELAKLKANSGVKESYDQMMSIETIMKILHYADRHTVPHAAVSQDAVPQAQRPYTEAPPDARREATMAPSQPERPSQREERQRGALACALPPIRRYFLDEADCELIVALKAGPADFQITVQDQTIPAATSCLKGES
jgi:hypothetical protein